MITFIAKRLVQSVLLIVSVTIIVFVAVWLIGNPVDILISPEATEADRQAAIEDLGLEKPLIEQYAAFVSNAVSGDWGRSFVYKEPVGKILLSRIPASVELAFVAFLMAVLVSVPLGLYAGLKPQSPLSRGIMAFSLLGVSIPQFWQGMMLIILLAIELPLFAVGDRGPTTTFLGITSSLWTLEGWRHVTLPAFNLALLNMSLLIRIIRASTIETRNLDFVKFATSKGISASRVVVRHIFRNSLIPVVTVMGIELGNLLAYGVVTETVFSWPGLGQLLINSIRVLDRPLIIAQLIYISVLFVTINFVVDLLYMVIDPRTRQNLLGSR